MKICIIGYSGSGKSELADKLSHFYQIPVLHLDNFKDRKEQEEMELYLKKQDSIEDFVLVQTESFYLDYQNRNTLTNIGQTYVENQGNSFLKQNYHCTDVNVYFIDDNDNLIMITLIKTNEMLEDKKYEALDTEKLIEDFSEVILKIYNTHQVFFFL